MIRAEQPCQVVSRVQMELGPFPRRDALSIACVHIGFLLSNNGVVLSRLHQAFTCVSPRLLPLANGRYQ